jgi:site-specific recombinase XerD
MKNACQPYEQNLTLNKVLILFRIRKNTIYVRITHNRQRCRNDFSIHERVVPPKNKKRPMVGEWDAKAQQVKGNGPEAQLINAKLEHIRSQIRAFAMHLTVLGKPYTADTLKSLYLGESKLTHSLTETSEMMLEFMDRQPVDEVARGTLKGYRTRHNNMVEFLRARNFYHLTPEEFAPSIARDFLQYMRTEHQPKASQTHAAKCLEYIKKVIKHAFNQEAIKFNPLQAFTIKKGESRPTPFLTQDERDRLESQVFELERLQEVKDLFVFLIHTGLSYADSVVFRASLHVVKRGDLYCLDMSRIKTGVDFYVPLTRTAWWILQRYGGERLPSRSNVNTNAYLKEIQTICQIGTKLTVRVARATCGVILLNEMNVPMETVSKMLGHKNIRTTQKYYAKVLRHKIIHDVVAKNPSRYEYHKID